MALHELSQANCRDDIRRTAKRKMDLRMDGATFSVSDSNVVGTGSKCFDELQHVGFAAA
jgi:hypothetical protein